MIKIKIVGLVMPNLILLESLANEGKQQKVNHRSIPPAISPDDSDMQKKQIRY